MNEQEFAQRLFEVCRDVNNIVMQHVAINRSMGVEGSLTGWDDQKRKMEIVAEGFYQECRDAFSKVQKFG